MGTFEGVMTRFVIMLPGNKFGYYCNEQLRVHKEEHNAFTLGSGDFYEVKDGEIILKG